MKAVVCLISICAGVAASAEKCVDAGQVVSIITDAIAVDRNDKRMARSLRSLCLTERLTDETTELLLKMGIGHETARALEALRKKSARLPVPALDVLSLTPAPSLTEQQEIVGRMEHYVAEYRARFPDFIATENVRQYHNYNAGFAPSFAWGFEKRVITVDDRWHEAAVYRTEAAYAAGHEYVAAGKAKHDEGFRVSRGEFGGMMEEIFDRSRSATFEWDRWQVVGGTRTAVFTYRVAPESSRYEVCCHLNTDEASKPRKEYVKAGHRGFVFVEPRSGEVKRLILFATGLTDPADVNAAGHVLEYGSVSIDGRQYSLPVRSIAFVRIGRYESREEIEYGNYRKFASESIINFTEDRE